MERLTVHQRRRLISTAVFLIGVGIFIVSVFSATNAWTSVTELETAAIAGGEFTEEEYTEALNQFQLGVAGVAIGFAAMLFAMFRRIDAQ